MRKLVAIALLSIVVGAVRVGEYADASTTQHLRQIGQVQLRVGGIPRHVGALAFSDRLVIAGTTVLDHVQAFTQPQHEGLGIFKILKGPPYLRQIGSYRCPGTLEGEVSVWRSFVTMSVGGETPHESGRRLPGNDFVSSRCNNTDDSAGRIGVRVVDISDPGRPRQVAFVSTECGSHTHTLLPRGDHALLYVGTSCHIPNPIGGGTGTMEVLRLDKSGAARRVNTASIEPARGCHDITLFPAKRLGLCVGDVAVAVLDLSDAARPLTLSMVERPEAQFQYAQFSWDGRSALVAGVRDGGLLPGACGGQGELMTGGVWALDLANPLNPILKGRYQPEEVALAPRGCHATAFSTLPTRDGSRLATLPYADGGLVLLDFTDLDHPYEVDRFVPTSSGLGPAAHWYNGRIYASDLWSDAGIRVFRMKNDGPKRIRRFRGPYNPQTQRRSFAL